MKLKIVFFANYKELLGLSELSVELSEGAKVSELCELLATKGNQWQLVFEQDNLKVAINHELANIDSTLSNNDEVAFFPPVTGG